MNNNEEIKCDDCSEIIEEGDEMSCDGSAQDGLTLCSYCWYEFTDNRDEEGGLGCSCEECYDRGYWNDIDCKIDDMKMNE
jgi:hypothetical protein